LTDTILGFLPVALEISALIFLPSTFKYSTALIYLVRFKQDQRLARHLSSTRPTNRKAICLHSFRLTCQSFTSILLKMLAYTISCPFRVACKSWLCRSPALDWRPPYCPNHGESRIASKCFLVSSGLWMPQIAYKAKQNL
jgi:hypothetical protein